jgi:hypothetical protein
VKIMARTPQDAEEIARLKFPKTFTERCILDKVEVIL